MTKKTAKIIDGKKIADKILWELKGKIARLNRPPGLAVILVGDDPASRLYVNNKKKAADKIGVKFCEYLCGNKFYSNITEKKILEMIEFLNHDSEIDAIIVQLPLPQKFNTEKIINQIKNEKDVDVFKNKKAELIQDKTIISPPLVQAVDEALKSTGQNLKAKKAVIVAKNPIFSRPMKKNLEIKDVQVEIIKPNKKMAAKTKMADILIVIVGQKNLIKKTMVKPGAIVVDIGTNLMAKNKWVGDVDSKVREIASWLTPVPGGIGPLTVAMLLKNTYQLAKNNSLKI